jgi:hypothetical protein
LLTRAEISPSSFINFLIEPLGRLDASKEMRG